VMVAYGEDGVPLQAGQGLASPGLAVEALSMDSHALTLTLAGRQWLLLPDRQALWAWQSQPRVPGDGLWLGFPPRAHERRRLLTHSPGRVWLSGAAPPRQPLPPGWSASGESGSLVAG
jgi:competence protein ComEC